MRISDWSSTCALPISYRTFPRRYKPCPPGSFVQHEHGRCEGREWNRRPCRGTGRRGFPANRSGPVVQRRLHRTSSSLPTPRPARRPCPGPFFQCSFPFIPCPFPRFRRFFCYSSSSFLFLSSLFCFFLVIFFFFFFFF